MGTGRRDLENLTRSESRALRELLLTATSAAGRPERSTELPALVDAAPVEALPAAASHHRVAGSVHKGLLGVDRVPVVVMEELEMITAHAALSHLRFVGALSEIVDSFDAAKLHWAVMKGPVLAAHHYPDIGDRSYSDVDLLVDPRDFPDAARILEGIGYTHRTHNWALAEVMLAGQLGMDRGTMRIDLHWHLHYAREDRRPYAFRPDEMVSRSRRVEVSGLTVPTLDPVDTLLTVAFHAARSDGHALVWSKDLERILAVDAPDLDELVDRCREARCAPSVGLMLAQAHELLAADVPDALVTGLVPRPLLVAHHTAQTWSHPIQFTSGGTISRVFTRSVRPSVRETIGVLPARSLRQFRRRFFPPPENETNDLVEKATYFTAVATTAGPHRSDRGDDLRADHRLPLR